MKIFTMMASYEVQSATDLDVRIMSAKFTALSKAACRTAALVFALATVVAAGPRSAMAQTAANAAERPDAVAVMVDQAKVIRLPEKTQTVIVGNPMIADITVQKNGILVVTGKSFGVTNFIALDANGSLLAESRVTVRAATDAVVTVQRGMERESYSCAPQCQPAIQLGDSTRFFGEVGGQAISRNQMSSPQR
jgi:Flp pilus assembly secretin CpaC